MAQVVRRDQSTDGRRPPLPARSSLLQALLLSLRDDRILAVDVLHQASQTLEHPDPLQERELTEVRLREEDEADYRPFAAGQLSDMRNEIARVKIS